MAEVIRVNGSREPVEPKNGHRFEFTGEAYNLIGATTIQIVATHDGHAMLIDEEGKLKGKPVNRAASEAYQYGAMDPIVGDVLVCKWSQLR